MTWSVWHTNLSIIIVVEITSIKEQVFEMFGPESQDQRVLGEYSALDAAF